MAIRINGDKLFRGARRHDKWIQSLAIRNPGTEQIKQSLNRWWIRRYTEWSYKVISNGFPSVQGWKRRLTHYRKEQKDRNPCAGLMNLFNPKLNLFLTLTSSRVTATMLFIRLTCYIEM